MDACHDDVIYNSVLTAHWQSIGDRFNAKKKEPERESSWNSDHERYMSIDFLKKSKSSNIAGARAHTIYILTSCFTMDGNGQVNARHAADSRGRIATSITTVSRGGHERLSIFALDGRLLRRLARDVDVVTAAAGARGAPEALARS